MQGRLGDYQERRLPEILDGLTQRIFNDYSKAVVDALNARLVLRREELEADRNEIASELRQIRKVLNRLDEMGIASARARSAVEKLAICYQEADPDLLVQPVASSGGSGEKPLASIEEAYVEERLDDVRKPEHSRESEPSENEAIDEIEL